MGAWEHDTIACMWVRVMVPSPIRCPGDNTHGLGSR